MSDSRPSLSVLIGDPSSHMAALVAQMLHTLRIRSVQAVVSADAVAAELARRSFDIVMLDEDMAGGDDFALVRFLRQTPDHPNRLVPIIMMAGAPGARTVAAARDAGVTEFLRKPFSVDHVRMRIEAVRTAPRQFVEAPGYVGPDRRRRTVSVKARRRTTDAADSGS